MRIAKTEIFSSTSRLVKIVLAKLEGMAATYFDIGDGSLGQEILAQTKSSAAGIPTRPLGKTGIQVSILCLGGWHIGEVQDKKEAIKIMHAALDEGITFFDNAWDYHDGG